MLLSRGGPFPRAVDTAQDRSESDKLALRSLRILALTWLVSGMLLYIGFEVVVRLVQWPDPGMITELEKEAGRVGAGVSWQPGPYGYDLGGVRREAQHPEALW